MLLMGFGCGRRLLPLLPPLPLLLLLLLLPPWPLTVSLRMMRTVDLLAVVDVLQPCVMTLARCFWQCLRDRDGQHVCGGGVRVQIKSSFLPLLAIHH